MKVITEKFPKVKGMGVNREWRFDQKQCRKSVDQERYRGRKMPGASEGEHASPRG